MQLACFFPESVACLEPRRAVIAVLVSEIANPFFVKVIPAIEERLAAAGFVTLFGNTSEDHAKEERILKTLQSFPPKGFLICPSLRPEDAAPTPLSLAGRLPTVAFARPVPGLDYAGVNYALGAGLAVDHFYQIGYRKIAFVGGNPHAATRQERLAGYRQALVRWGLPVDPRWVVNCAPNRAGGQQSLEALLQLEDPPTAAVCFNDLVAVGAMETLERLGKNPGARFGIIGFNDVPAAAHNRPGLTTVDISPRQLGEAAAELLLRRLGNRNFLLQTVVLQPRLIVRESCGTVI